ncbi:MAG: YraN family protein [Alphaproteobacteria bacterium]|nr:YraN family protein [Alphaproteobacteria bacterium]MBP9877444.1 YraN family protein [Alphaproteobacteria bacterium]
MVKKYKSIKARHSYGKWGERFAIIFLMLKGYKILHHNYESPLGEIDIIARRKNDLCFIEVKSRQTTEEASYAISQTQLHRIKRAATAYIARQDRYVRLNHRFDAIYIRPWSLPIHLKNILET